MCILAPVGVEQTFTFIEKGMKLSVRSAFDIKTFDPEQLEKIVDYYCDVVNCSYRTGTSPECVKNVFMKPMLTKKNSNTNILKSYRPL